MTTFTREDFEHAARAAGLRVRTWDGHTGVMCAIDDDHHGRMWMPPHDDGDALRLAVACGMFLRCGSLCGVEHPVTVEMGNKEADAVAIRHAIFRAAIAVGKAMLARESAEAAAYSIERAFLIDAPDLRPNRGDVAESPSVGSADQQTEHQIKGDAS